MSATEQVTEQSLEPRIGRSVSLDHAAELLGVSRRTIYNRIREGRLLTVRTLGGSQRVLIDSVQHGSRANAARRAAAAASEVQVRSTVPQGGAHGGSAQVDISPVRSRRCSRRWRVRRRWPTAGPGSASAPGATERGPCRPSGGGFVLGRSHCRRRQGRRRSAGPRDTTWSSSATCAAAACFESTRDNSPHCSPTTSWIICRETSNIDRRPSIPPSNPR